MPNTFVATNYDTQAADLQRRQKLADLLQQQSMEPVDVPTYQGIQAQIAPSQILAKILGGYSANKQQQDVMQRQQALQQQKAQAVQEATSNILGSLKAGDKDTALQHAMSDAGRIALQESPALASMVQTALAPKPAAIGNVDPDKFTPGSLARFNQTHDYNDLVPKPEKAPAPQAPHTVTVMVNGKPMVKNIVTGEIVGEAPPSAASLAQEAREARLAQQAAIADQQKAQTSVSTQKALDDAANLYVHPGRLAATGGSNWMANIPGTEARNFKARLDTFKAETFVPMVSALKGMGALSDAEGRKLTESVGSLDTGMTEDEFAKSLYETTKFLYDKAKASGLNVTMPSFKGLESAPSTPSANNDLIAAALAEQARRKGKAK